MIRTALVSVLVTFLNPAPLAGAGDEGKENTRDTTPWFVSIPSLNVSVMVRDEHGEPVVGYFSDTDAVAYASAMWAMLTSDANQLKEAQSAPEYPATIDPHFKLMVRLISVPARK
jgi:hypothetical protein